MRRIELPSFGPPDPMPVLPPSLYAARLGRLREAAARRGFQRLVVYADREHSASISWLTGFDPRFEEAVVVVGPDDDPAILVGNECYGMAGDAPLPMRRHLHQDLSLPDQPRDRSRPIDEVLAEEGIQPGARVGVIGWKTFADPGWVDAPAWLVDRLRALVGASGSVSNATGLLIDPRDGLRTTNEPEQLAAFEHASRHTSGGMRRLLDGLRPGMTEQEAVALLGWNGMPLSCHLMLSTGPRVGGGCSPHRPGHRARRSLHLRLRGVGRAHVSRRLRGGGGQPAAGGRRGLRGASRGALLRGRRGVVRHDARWASPAGRSRRSSGVVWATRSLASSSTRATCSPWTSGYPARYGPARRCRCARGWPCRWTSSRPPARSTSRPTWRTASRSRTRRSATPSRAASRGLATHHGAPRVHGSGAGHRPGAGGPAAVRHARVPGAVRAPPDHVMTLA
ncbi:MAG: hypothetical protein R3C32_00095 [Chloroflexota bacterium]